MRTSVKLSGSRSEQRPLGSVLLALILLAAASRAHAQDLPIPAGTTEDEIRASAAREALTYPRRAAPQPVRTMFSPNQAGTAERRCVLGEDMGPVRSGEFVIGGQLGGSRALRGGVAGKVWWAPLHHALDMPPLVVRGRSLTSPEDTVRYTTSSVAWPVTRGAPPVPEALREYFFPSGIRIPRGGLWLLIATSGSNWGCFILRVH